MLERFIRWLVFSVVLALLPIGLNAIKTIFRAGETFAWLGLIEHGELLIIAAAVSAAAMGLLIGTGNGRFKIGKIIAGGAALIMTLVAASSYADLSAAIGAGVPMKPDAIFATSIVVFICSFVASAGCVVLGEK